MGARRKKMTHEMVLHSHVEHIKNKSFVYGEHDCFIFVFTFFNKIKKVEIGKEFFGKYKTHTGYMRLLKKNGYNSIDEYCNAFLKQKNINFANRCDLVLRNGCLGICDGMYSLFITDDGIKSFKTSECTHSWGVLNA